MAELTKKQLKMLESVSKNYKNFKRYKPENQFYELALKAISWDASMLAYVREDLKTEELCLRAMETHPLAIQYIPNPTDEMDDLFKNSSYAEEYFYLLKNPREEMALKAIKKHWMAIENVPKHLMTEKVILTAVKENAFALSWIPKEKQTEEVKMEAVKNNGAILAFMENQTPELCMIAYEQNPEFENFFKL